MEARPIVQPAWVDRNEFPFASRTFSHAHGRMHYVDEGRGPVVLFVHGTPDWSFGFRKLIGTLRTTHRCVALDHLGFGLSDKPANADLTVAAHARRLQAFIEHLGLKDLTLVVTDFGGGIGLEHALVHPDNVRGIVLYNTWMWDLMTDKRFARPAAIMGSWFGRMLYLYLGFSVNVMMPAAYGDRSKLTKAIHAHFKKALPDPASRAATFVCVRELRNAGRFWHAQWERSRTLGAIPAVVCWGMRDRAVPPDLITRWREVLPQATLKTFGEAGHFLHEEAPEALAEVIRSQRASHV